MAFFLVVNNEVMAISGGGGGICGDGLCESGETSAGCSVDCNPCGDGVCDAGIGETPATCHTDCEGPFCGDGTCNVGENALSCLQDCSFPPPKPDPGIPSPSCKDVVIHVGEETTCSIKVENVATFPLTTATATVMIPHNIRKVSNTNTWGCSSTATGIKCNKAYSPYLNMGEMEYMELTLTSDVKNEYGLSAKISGVGESVRAVTYSSSQEVTTVAPPITADAVDDVSWCSSGRRRKNLSDNDILCSSGATTTFAYHDVITGVTVTNFSSNWGIISFTFDAGSIHNTPLLYYDILCNGTVVDTASLEYDCGGT